MINNKRFFKQILLTLTISAILSNSLIGVYSPKKVMASENYTKVTTFRDGVLKYEKGTLQTTRYGQVQGKLVNDDKILSWTGIPYAKAPVGDLRWKEPQDPDKFTETFDATKTANVGIQLSGNKVIGSEDCLNLNIYRPNTDEKDLPVLLYIHGGNNQTGTSLELSANNLAIAANCVVVSINYRLGALGFNNLPALKTGNVYEDSGNYTLLDISKSLDWIKNNINAFGGNSNNITAAGFSAGGRDVMAMLISPIFEGKFQKAISFSGGMTIADSEDSTKVIAKAIAPLVVEDKVKSTEEEAYNWLLTDDVEVKDYLYGLSAERLSALMGNASIRMSVFPHLYNDGIVLPKKGFETKNYNDVPLIMLTGSNEFSLFAKGDPYFAGLSDETLLNDPEKNAEIKFASGYGSKMYEYFNAEDSANRMIDKYNAPIYTCDIKWGTNEEIVGENMAELCGAWHGVFLPLLTGEISGISANYKEAFDNDGVKDLSDKFTKYISNFLWTSNPNGNNLVEWKPWTKEKNGPTQLLFDADKSKAIIKMSYDHTSYKEIIKEIENDTTVSEEVKEKLVEEVLNGRWFSSELDKYFNNSDLWVK